MSDAIESFEESEAFADIPNLSNASINPSSSPSNERVIEAEKKRLQALRQSRERDAYTDYSPPTPESPKVVPLSAVPTLPLPELAKASEGMQPEKKRREKKANTAEEKPSPFAPFGRFGMPFNTSDGSDIGLTPHPQLVIVRTVEDCFDTMAAGRNLTTKMILEVDHPKQDTLSKEVDERLAESIAIAQKNRQLSYIQRVLKVLTITAGIGGGSIVAPIAPVAGSTMIAGGALEIGSFILGQIGFGNSTWASVLALSGAALSFTGSIMGFPILADKLPSHLSSITTSVMALLNMYGVVRTAENTATQHKLSGELVTLAKDKKELSDDITKHYGALNIKDFAHLFKTASEFENLLNQATKNIIQGTLKG